MLGKFKKMWVRVGYFLVLIRWPAVAAGFAPGVLVGILLVAGVGTAAAFLWGSAFLCGTLMMLAFLVSPGEPAEDMELRVVIRELGKAGEYNLPELAGQTGLKARNFEHKLLDVIALEILTLAYYPPEQKIYIPDKGRDLHHCPRCAADFTAFSSGRCPNCKIRFSRVVLERPYRYN